VKQAKDYDPRGEYVRLWLPELQHVPDQHVHHPWTWDSAKQGKLSDYPSEPIIQRQEWRGQIQRVGGAKQEGKDGTGGRGGPRAKRAPKEKGQNKDGNQSGKREGAGQGPKGKEGKPAHVFV
jgi:deoxyribodipyrimidine photo-lyase